MNLKTAKKVIFASAKMVGGAPKNNKSSYSIKPLLFRGAFPYPVVLKILTIFVNECEKQYEKRKTCSIKLDIIDLKNLYILMKKMNTKNRSQTIRNCINLVMFQETNIDRMNDIDYKLNRLLYRETFIKDLLAQFF